jgi:hypothetical protein
LVLVRGEAGIGKTALSLLPLRIVLADLPGSARVTRLELADLSRRRWVVSRGGRRSTPMNRRRNRR